MKTWFNFIPVIAIAILIPIIAILIPTVQIKNNHIGGGPIRQYLVNLIVDIMKPEYANKTVELFNQGSVGVEILLTLPIALNISCFGLILSACLCGLYIEICNYFTSGIYKSQRQRAKGAR